MKKYYIFLFVFSCLFLISLSCTNKYLVNITPSKEEIVLKTNDLIKITLKNGALIEGIFLRKENNIIIINKLESGNAKQTALKLDTIEMIKIIGEAPKKNPNILITIGLIAFILYFFLGILNIFPGMGGAGV